MQSRRWRGQKPDYRRFLNDWEVDCGGREEYRRLTMSGCGEEERGSSQLDQEKGEELFFLFFLSKIRETWSMFKYWRE